jgi:aldehyde dehydrogenase (NAD+)
MGPLVSERQYARVTDLIRLGAREATLVTGGAGMYCPTPRNVPSAHDHGNGFPMLCVSDKPAGVEAGYYVQPTVFTQVSNDMAIAQQEVCYLGHIGRCDRAAVRGHVGAKGASHWQIFGPVLAIIPYRTEAEAVRIANDTPYGLAAYVSGAKDHVHKVHWAGRGVRPDAVSCRSGGF